MSTADRLAEALATIKATAELMTVTAVQVKRVQEVMAYGAPVDGCLNPSYGDVIETVTIRYRGATRSTPVRSDDTDDAAGDTDQVRLTGDYAEVLTELLRRARPADRVEIEHTGMTALPLTLGPHTDWLKEAAEIAEDMVGRKLIKVTTWMLEPVALVPKMG
jgi:hypothetical protein